MEARIRSDSEEELEVGEVQVVEKGDHYCELCKLDLVTTDKLKSHVIRFHEGKFRYLCIPCSKGYMSKDGLRLHEKSHKTGYTNCPVEDITKTFIQIKFRNTDVSFSHSTSLSEQCGI